MDIAPVVRPQRCLVVLGMHRSGTSALTGMAGLLGVAPGENLLPAVADVNPKGFWEHAEIVSIHNQLLEAFDSSWDDDRPLPDRWWRTSTAATFRMMLLAVLRRDFGGHSLWLVKDPRLCRLLPLWLDMFDELECQPHFVISLRNPADVAHSLRMRDALPEAQSCMLWLSHMLDAEYLTRGLPRVFISYDRLLTNWRQVAIDIEQTLSLSWPLPIVQASSKVDAFLDPALCHHAGDIPLTPHPACGLALETYAAMSSAEPDSAELDRLRQQAIELENIVAPWSRSRLMGERKSYRLAVTQLEPEIVQLRADLVRIKSTLSWQVTKPLRLIAGIARRLQSSLAGRGKNRQ